MEFVQMFSDFIQNFGFPVACVIALFYKSNKDNQLFSDTLKNNTMALENNNKVLEKISDRIDRLEDKVTK